MQTDPIGYGDGMNLYAYVKNDSVNRVDPTGLNCVAVWEPVYNADGTLAGENFLGQDCGGGGDGGGWDWGPIREVIPSNWDGVMMAMAAWLSHR